ncbi:MAG: hypothetical protein KY457_03185 [Actinobacteria bacterium]|nr:hypothetical protein [Actinomycetota bacterium]
MNEALIVMLALLWAVALLPGAVRSRRVNTHATVGGFERAMDVLRRQPDGRYMMVPNDAGRIVGDAAASARGDAVGAATAGSRGLRREDPVVARRRTVFVRALAATATLFVVALLAGGFAWTLFTLSLLATGGYAALLRHLKLRRDEVREVVRDIRADQVVDLRDERLPVAVGAAPMFGDGVPVASRHDEPWQPQTAVRIRRWED